MSGGIRGTLVYIYIVADEQTTLQKVAMCEEHRSKWSHRLLCKRACSHAARKSKKNMRFPFLHGDPPLPSRLYFLNFLMRPLSHVLLILLSVRLILLLFLLIFNLNYLTFPKK